MQSNVDYEIAMIMTTVKDAKDTGTLGDLLIERRLAACILRN